MAKKEETTFYRFYSEVKAFITKLMNSPIKAEPSKYLKDRDFTKARLIKLLMNEGILVRDEKILIPGKDDVKNVTYSVRYSLKTGINGSNQDSFEDKLEKIHAKYFPESVDYKKTNKETKKEEIDECDCAGATNCSSSGAFVQPAFPIQRRNIYLTEGQLEYIQKSLLQENKESKNMSKARNLLYQHGYSQEDAQKTIEAIRNDIPYSRLADCKFLLGVTRMYLNGEVTDWQKMSNLNQTLKIVASDEYVNKFDNNLNNISLNELVSQFTSIFQANLAADKEKLNQNIYNKNKSYSIVPIDDPYAAYEYGDYVNWCITQDDEAYDDYTHGGSGRFYFCLRKGFEKVPKVQGKNCPLDEYGLSMIAVSVNEDGSCNTITCRWNHDNGGNDNIMTPEQLSNLLGVNFYQTFKPYSKEELRKRGIISYEDVPELLAQGESPDDIFDFFYEGDDGIDTVEIRGKYNFLLNNKTLLFPNAWLLEAGVFHNGVASVKFQDRRANFINTKGEVIFPNQWFDATRDFLNGVAIVYRDNKGNFIDTNGKLLSNEWFDSVSYFDENDVAIVSKDKYGDNLLKKDGTFVSQNWYKDIVYAYDGIIYRVQNYDNLFNYINLDGNIISPNLWFNDATNFFDDTFAIVKVDTKCYVINKEGKILNKQGYDDIQYMGFKHDHICRVALQKINNFYNYIDVDNDGRLISPNLWFIQADASFGYGANGTANVNNGTWILNRDGVLMNDETNEIIFQNDLAKMTNEQKAKLFGKYCNPKEVEGVVAESKTQLLQEIAIDKKYDIEKQKGKTNLDLQTYRTICELDPTTKNNNAGQYCNWLLQRVTPEMLGNPQLIQKLKTSLEQFSDGVKRGILQRNGISNDIGTFKSVEDLVQTIGGLMKQGTQVSQSIANNMSKLNGQYSIISETPNWYIIEPNTFEAERYFGSGTEWCTVANEDYWDEYIEDGQLYITYPKNGDDTLKMQFHFETNSFASYNDTVYNNPKKCIYAVLGENERKEVIDMWEETGEFDVYNDPVDFKDVPQLLERGVNPKKIFDTVHKEYNGISVVRLENKYNYINHENKLLSPNQWFDKVWDFEYGSVTMVMIGDDFYQYHRGATKASYNFINTNGDIISNQWFDRITRFERNTDDENAIEKEPIFVVLLRGKESIANKDGKLISNNLWFDDIRPSDSTEYAHDYASYFTVRSNGKYNVLKYDGTLLSKTWFDKIRKQGKDSRRVQNDYLDGVYWTVENNNKSNYMNSEGVILSPELWFDEVNEFEYGFASVNIKHKYNFIDTNGKLLWKHPFDEWFYQAYKFKSNGYAIVCNEDYDANLIDRNGNIISPNLWFSKIDNNIDKNGFFRVILNFKFNLMNTKGELLSPDFWFARIYDFNDNIQAYRVGTSAFGGFKENFLTLNGKLLLSSWYHTLERMTPNKYLYMIGNHNEYNMIDIREPNKAIFGEWLYNINGHNSVNGVYTITTREYYFELRQYREKDKYELKVTPNGFTIFHTNGIPLTQEELKRLHVNYKPETVEQQVNENKLNGKRIYLTEEQLKYIKSKKTNNKLKK